MQKQVGKNVGRDMNQNCTFINIYEVYEKIHNLMEENRIDEVEKILDIEDTIIARYHPLYPDYIIARKAVGDKKVFYSKPANENAIKKLPPGLKGEFKISKKYSGFKNIDELFQNAYNNQTEIEITNLKLEKMIGDKIDPYQDEIKLLIPEGSNWSIKPEPFPEAKPFKLIIKENNITYDYLLLRTTRIESNKVFISNEEQNIDTKFEFIFNFENKKVNINVNLNTMSKVKNSEYFKYLNFIKSMINQFEFMIIDLESNSVFVEGKLDKLDYKTSLEELNAKIKFVEYLISIEKHYNICLEIPQNVKKEDLDSVYMLGKVIEGYELEGFWTEISQSIEISNEFKNNIENFEDVMGELKYIEFKKFHIFSKLISIHEVITIFKNAKIKELNKLKAKIKVFDEGDSITVKIFPNGENKFIQKIIIDKNYI